MESADKIEPEYQRLAMEQCCAVVLKYLNKHNNI